MEKDDKENSETTFTEISNYKDVSFLDFSTLGESTLYLNGIYSPHVHFSDVKYLREISSKVEHNETGFRKPLVNDALGRELFIRLSYLDKAPLEDNYSTETLLNQIIWSGLMFWEPQELSCSWIGKRTEDYILRICGTDEYLEDNTRKLSDFLRSVGEMEELELELVERSRLELQMKTKAYNVEKKRRTSRSCLPSFAVKDDVVICFSGIGGITQQHLKDFAVYASYEDIVFEIEFELRHNTIPLCASQTIEISYNKLNKKLNELIFFSIKISDLPRCVYIRAYISAYRSSPGGFRGMMQNLLFLESSTPSVVGWADYPLYNFQGFLNVEAHRTNIQSGNPHPFYLGCSEIEDGAYVALSTQVSVSDTIIHSYKFEPKKKGSNKTRRTMKDLEKIAHDKASDTLLWKYRKEIAKQFPEKLLVLLKSIDWRNSSYVAGVEELLQEYPVIHSFAGLKILALPVCNIPLWEYAVKCLWSLSDSEIISIIPQLIQSIKREMYICGPISRFLLTKALSRKAIGYVMYWHIKSEMDEDNLYSRFNIIKQCYLENIAANYRREILAIERIFEDLIKIAKLAQNVSLTPEQFRTRLWDIRFPKEGCCLPSSGEIKVAGLCVEECSVLNSKTRPLWLTFENFDTKDTKIERDKEKVYAILKIGDDIRVDGLALQMMQILDGLWKNEDLDLHLQPYVTLPLKQKVGLIQVANKAESTSSINWKHGGNGFTSAFSTTSLKAFLYKNNIGFERERAFRNFALSCAGYCVFTYVFGVGDRHGDNIMCTKEGNIFHIDFGYFLGERSRFLGIARESGYFVLTPNYINAMDDFFELFIERACSGFEIAQRHGHIFSTLIELMMPCGPEVLTVDQSQFVKRSLGQWDGEREGKKKFYNIIDKSLQDKRTLLNEFAHLVATRKV